MEPAHIHGFKNKRLQTAYYWARRNTELANLFLIQSLLVLPHKTTTLNITRLSAKSWRKILAVSKPRSCQGKLSETEEKEAWTHSVAAETNAEQGPKWTKNSLTIQPLCKSPNLTAYESISCQQPAYSHAKSCSCSKHAF